MFWEKGRKSSIQESIGDTDGTITGDGDADDEDVLVSVADFEGENETPMLLKAVDLLVMVSKVQGICCATNKANQIRY